MILLIIIAATVLFGPHLWAKYVLNRHNRHEYFSGSGIDLARLALEQAKIRDVTVETTEVGDHYDPVEKTIRLTKKVCDENRLLPSW